MLITLVIWLYMLGLCYVYGQLLLRLVGKLLGAGADSENPILTTLAGLALLTALASYFSLFFQIGVWINLILLSGALILVLRRQVTLPKLNTRIFYSLLGACLLVLALLIVLENATHLPSNPDTVIYHAQAIHWIEDYPAVPGLGNLHGRLAFNSAWFLSNALFSFAFVGGQSYHLAGGLIFLLFLLYCWPGLQAVLKGDFSFIALIKSAFIPLSFLVMGSELSSPGTDLPANLLIWLAALLWVEQAEKPRSLQPFLIALLAVFAVTVKLSAMPVLLLVLILFIQQLLRRDARQAALLAGTGAFILLPFLARNVILSGYLVYPFPAVDLFQFDWKVPAARATQERLSILAWGRLPRQNPEQVLALPPGTWLPLWLAKQTLARRLLALAALLSPLLALPLGWRRPSVRMSLAAWLVMFTGACFWQVSAPDFRFGYGFLIPAVLLAVLPWGSQAAGRLGRFSGMVGRSLGLLVGLFLALTLVNSLEVRNLAGRLLQPEDYPRVPTEPCALANGQVFCAKSLDACSYHDFPCIPAARPWVELRGPSLQDGFRALP